MPQYGSFRYFLSMRYLNCALMLPRALANECKGEEHTCYDQQHHGCAFRHYFTIIDQELVRKEGRKDEKKL